MGYRSAVQCGRVRRRGDTAVSTVSQETAQQGQYVRTFSPFTPMLAGSFSLRIIPTWSTFMKFCKARRDWRFQPDRIMQGGPVQSLVCGAVIGASLRA